MISAMASMMLSGSHASDSVTGYTVGHGGGGGSGDHDSSTGNNPINCITATSRGFVTASLHGEFKLFERNEDIKERYSVEETYKIPGSLRTNKCLLNQLGCLEESYIFVTLVQALFSLTDI